MIVRWLQFRGSRTLEIVCTSKPTRNLGRALRLLLSLSNGPLCATFNLALGSVRLCFGLKVAPRAENKRQAFCFEFLYFFPHSVAAEFLVLSGYVLEFM